MLTLSISTNIDAVNIISLEIVMRSKILISIAALPLLILTPALEVNDTHLFSPLWPAHARLHEAWQLIANWGLAVLCLWLTWSKGASRLAAAILLTPVAGFLIAFLLKDTYGGSMTHADGATLSMGGVNPAPVVMGVAFLCLVLALRTGRAPAGQA